VARPTGYVFRLEKTRGASWWAKYRLPDGTQVKRKIGPAWTGRGRPAEGHFTKRLADDWLRDRLEELYRESEAAAAGARAAAVATGVTFAEAAAEYLRFAEHDRGCKPTTVRGYRNTISVHLLPAFGSMKLEEITVQEIERWRAGMTGVRTGRRELSNKTKNNLLVLMHAILRRAVKLYGLPANPVANVDRFRVRSSGDIQVFSPEEIWALVRAAGSEADAAIFLTAAFTGLRRGELLGLRWRDVDFAGSTIRVRASYAAGKLTTPKSGKVRSVPMAPDVATALAKLGDRARFVGDDDFVFAGEHGPPLDGDALSSRYRDALARAGLRPLRFHDLRHTFGTRMIAKADIRRVQEWMGHADIQTTMKYLHYAPRAEDAQLVAEAFVRTPVAQSKA
jgi:integrase